MRELGSKPKAETEERCWGGEGLAGGGVSPGRDPLPRPRPPGASGLGFGCPRPRRAGPAPPGAGASPSVPTPGLSGGRPGAEPPRCGERAAWGAWRPQTPWPRAWSSVWAASPSSPATTSRATGAGWPAAASARCSGCGTGAGGRSSPSSVPPASSPRPPGTCRPRPSS